MRERFWSLKCGTAALMIAACLTAPLSARGWIPMEDERGYLAQDETVAILAKQKPQPAESVVAVAEQFKGLPYIWAGTSAGAGFDCSGYVYEVMRLNGYSVPRMADHQFEQSRRVEKSELERGDMVFFTTYLPGPSHVGIYLGDGEFIHASSAAEGVVVSQLREGYYSDRFLGGGRPEGWVSSTSAQVTGPVVDLTSPPTLPQEIEKTAVVSPRPESPTSFEVLDEWEIVVEAEERAKPEVAVSDTVPFNEPIDTKAEEAGLKLQLQLGEMWALGRLGLSDLLDRVTDGLASLSPTAQEDRS